MAKRPGMLRKLWVGFKGSFAKSVKPTYLGKDEFGNYYFEKIGDPKANRRASRWLEGREKDLSHEPDIPMEWRAWLQYKREAPPTEDEINANRVTTIRTAHRANAIEQHDQQIADQAKESSPQVHTTTISPDMLMEKRKFPIYDDLESQPGSIPKETVK